DALGSIGSERAVEPLISRLDDSDEDVRRAVIDALGSIGSERSLAPLISRLDDSDEDVRRAAVDSMSKKLGHKERYLLSRDLDGMIPFIDPSEEINDVLVEMAAKKLDLSVIEVRACYESLAERFHLKLSWTKQE
ncbi:MAG: HEAT repeat domain-containing protein, partial [Methanothrix sp.]|nr:HEAT repeat domain-containing protein [Methanothrix sp.]